MRQGFEHLEIGARVPERQYFATHFKVATKYFRINIKVNVTVENVNMKSFCFLK